MKWLVIAAIVAVALFAWSLTRVSSDAVAMAIGMILGVLSTATTPALILLTRRDAPVTYIVLAAPLGDSGRIGLNTPVQMIAPNGDVPGDSRGESWNLH